MRLSTERDRDEARGVATLHAAFDAGITFLDTADAYCWDCDETGHNERLIARALASWGGDRSCIVIATKGGLTRPQGAWVPDGRARHLREACEASCRALGVERIPLYQLHAVDPRIPFSTSVRALAALQRDGLVESIGLCNVNVGQIEEARGIADIASVQVELSPWHAANVMSGVVEYCISSGIQLLAYRPLGGAQNRRRISSDSVLLEVAAGHRATPFEIVLAWLRGLSDSIVPLPGPAREETARSVARAGLIALTDDDRAVLDKHLPTARALRFRQGSRDSRPHESGDEIVLIMGLPGAGKSTVAETFVARGYRRLNRDESGGTLAGLLPALDRAAESGSSRIVLDNTYVSRKSRAAVIQAAWKRGLPVRCLWLTTSVEDAQVNAVTRIVSRYGRLLTPEEMQAMRKRDIAAFGPTVQFRYQRELEPPDESEGFSAIERVPFERRHNPEHVNRALIVWCDGVLQRSRSGQRTPLSPDDVDVFADRADALRRYQADGWRLLGMSWQPEVADKVLAPADVDRIFARTQELLGVSIEIEYCPHGAGPPTCWCRKPLPGLGVAFVERHKLDPSTCIYVGAGPQDPLFARRMGFQYREASEFWQS
jgi:aryl-alcohol dehydrogenase-like predicted oxidoreductase/histidinol phosphatase-like enzyme/predicted kinase